MRHCTPSEKCLPPTLGQRCNEARTHLFDWCARMIYTFEKKNVYPMKVIVNPFDISPYKNTGSCNRGKSHSRHTPTCLLKQPSTASADRLTLHTHTWICRLVSLHNTLTPRGPAGASDFGMRGGYKYLRYKAPVGSKGNVAEVRNARTTRLNFIV